MILRIEHNLFKNLSKIRINQGRVSVEESTEDLKSIPPPTVIKSVKIGKKKPFPGYNLCNVGGIPGMEKHNTDKLVGILNFTNEYELFYIYQVFFFTYLIYLLLMCQRQQKHDVHTI